MIKPVLLAAALLASTTASAQPAKPDAPQTDEQKRAEAKALYNKGINHYNLGEFDPAIAAFRQAYGISSAPGLLFNIAQAFRLKKDYEQASYFYTTYLRLKPDASNRADVEARIAEMKTLLEDQKKLGNSPPTGTITPEGDTGTKPPPMTTPPTTPPPTVTATKDPAVTVGPIEEGPGPRVDRPGATMKTAGLATAGVGGALILTGIIFGRMASSAESDLNALNMGGTWTQADQDTYDAGKRNNAIAIVSLIAGGAAVVTGGALYFLGRSKDSAASVAVVPARGGTSVAVGWSF
jgi:tetratricopeptide (TPR) repeat protein